MPNDAIKFRGFVRIECIAPDGTVKWVLDGENLVVDEGVNFILNTSLSGSTQDTTFFVGLKGAGTVAAADTMASHAGWTEDQNYTESTRVAWTENDTGADKSVSNSSSPAAFSMNATTTIAGAFLSTDSTKGGTAGTLIAAKDFGVSVSAGNGDTLNVTYTINASAS